MVGDVSRLIGRGFVASSGNIAGTYKLGPGGIGVWWFDAPSENDAREYNAWALAVLGGASKYEAHSEINANSAEARKQYRKWLSKQP